MYLLHPPPRSTPVLKGCLPQLELYQDDIGELWIDSSLCYLLSQIFKQEKKLAVMQMCLLWTVQYCFGYKNELIATSIKFE